MLPLDMSLPLRLTYSIPLPLWRQTPKPKGQSTGLQQTSWALRYEERAETRCHHHLNQSSEQSDPL